MMPHSIDICIHTLQHLGSPGWYTLRGFSMNSALGLFLQPYQSVAGGGTFESVATILFFTLLWHYETTSPAEKPLFLVPNCLPAQVFPP